MSEKIKVSAHLAALEHEDADKFDRTSAQIVRLLAVRVHVLEAWVRCLENPAIARHETHQALVDSKAATDAALDLGGLTT